MELVHVDGFALLQAAEDIDFLHGIFHATVFILSFGLEVDGVRLEDLDRHDLSSLDVRATASTPLVSADNRAQIDRLDSLPLVDAAVGSLSDQLTEPVL